MMLSHLTVIEQMADSVIITNREGIIEYVNPAFEAMTGFSNDECIGRKTSLLQSGVQPRHFYETLWSTILAGDPFHAVITNRRRDGRLFALEQTITPIRNAEGTITHFVSTGRDITARRRAQVSQLRHRLDYEGRCLATVLHADTGQFLALAHMTLAEIAAHVDPGVAEQLKQVRQYLDRVEERLRTATRGTQAGS
jgi:PAS domain S-box-containing protein